MHAFDVLGDPVRRRILELLAAGERPAGEIVATIGAEFGISQPAVSQHLRVLKAAGLVTETAQGTRRIYRIDPRGIAAMRDWLDAHWIAALAAFKDFADAQPDQETPE